MNPILSIVTVNLNNSEGLRRTLESIDKQKFKNIEVIVVDGGSTDESKLVANKFTHLISFFVSEPDSGVYDAMNKGIRQSHGMFVHLLNSGDTYLDDSVLLSIDFISQAYFFCFSVLKNTPKKYLWRPKLIDNERFVDCAHPGLIVRRSFYANNLYNAKYKYISDAIFIYKNVKPSLSIIDERILVEMEPNGLSSNISFEHELEKIHLLWREGYRKNKRVLLQVKYVLNFLLRILRIK